MQNIKKKGVTLLELLITITIMSLLFVVLFRAYTTISQVTFRAQQEKKIAQEIIWVAQTIQNISDTHKIDFDAYSGKNESKVQTDIIFLSGNDGKIAISSTGNCRDNNSEITGFSQEEKSDPCRLIRIDNLGKITNLTSTGESIISKVYFKIQPNQKNEDIIQNTGEDFPFLKIQQPGFRVLFKLYTPIYEKGNWTKTSNIIFQQFFNLQS